MASEENNGAANYMDPDLYRAAAGGDILEFVKAEQQGVEGRPATCVQLSPQKNTILHIATSFGHDEIVKLTCKDLPDLVEKKNSNGDTALHIAARAGNSTLVDLFLNCNEAILDLHNKEGNTALHEALLHRHKHVAWDLIRKGTNIPYGVNKEGKSILYLAAEAGYSDLVWFIFHGRVTINHGGEARQSKSPVHAAILGKNIYILKQMCKKDQLFFQLECEEGRNPLQLAASIDFVEGVKYLLEVFCFATYQKDENGFYPIHTASSKGHIKTVEEILHQCPDSRELLNQQGQNIFHVAAKSGKAKAVKCMLEMPVLKKLINEKDEDGNTPLHLATIYGHPKTLFNLTRNQRADLEIENNEGMTALDIAEDYMEAKASFRKRLTWMALRGAGSPRSNNCETGNYQYKRKVATRAKSTKLEDYKDKVNVILLVATLVATVTFAAGFTIPGGLYNSGKDQGIATMLAQTYFHIFVICDAIAMYGSIIVGVTLICAILGDTSPVRVALKVALPLLGLALAMMSMAFMAGLCLVVTKLKWLVIVVSVMGISFVIMLSALFVPLCILASSNYQNFRHFTHYPFRLMLLTLGSYTDDDDDDTEESLTKKKDTEESFNKEKGTEEESLDGKKYIIK